MLVLISTASFSQQITPAQPLTADDYLEKSKKQKSTGWVLLGGGTALSVIAIIGMKASSNASSDASLNTLGDISAWAIAGFVGSLAMMGSIPLFIASGRNLSISIAMHTTAYLKMESIPVIQQNSFVHNSYPALSIKFNLR